MDYYLGHSDSCTGDSGGPLWQFIGKVLFGFDSSGGFKNIGMEISSRSFNSFRFQMGEQQ